MLKAYICRKTPIFRPPSNAKSIPPISISRNNPDMILSNFLNVINYHPFLDNKRSSNKENIFFQSSMKVYKKIRNFAQ